MPTRADLRTALRLHLEDTGPTPLWDDTTLNESIAAAIRAYGVAVPRQVTTGVTVPAGATKVATGVTLDPDRIARVTDAAGIWVPPWPPWEDRPGQRTPGQAWRWWADELILAEPAASPPLVSGPSSTAPAAPRPPPTAKRSLSSPATKSSSLPMPRRPPSPAAPSKTPSAVSAPTPPPAPNPPAKKPSASWAAAAAGHACGNGL
jgi:hypothetical protein